jgi:hypothetical protein
VSSGWRPHPRTAAILASVALLAAACGRKPEKDAAASRPGGPPKGDAVWFTDPAGALEPGMDERLMRLSAAAVFLPAGALSTRSGRAVFEPGSPPAAAVAGAPVVLVVRGEPVVAVALAAEAGLDPEGTAAALAEGLRSLIQGGSFGRVAGVHLDFAFSPASAKRSGALVAALKAKLPGVWISIAAPFSPVTDEARKALRPLTERVDALVVPVFGLDARADAAAIDLLGPPWWAAFGAFSQGTIVSGGDPAPGAPEKWIDVLTGNPQVDFENDLSVPDANFSAFHLTARGPVALEGVRLESGDRVTYRVPALTEMLYQLGSTMAGKRHALGRLLVFGGAEEAGRIFPVGAFEDVILGRSLVPVMETRVSPAGRSAIAVEAVNRSTHASIASRTSNWVEVDLAPAHPADVALGGFDRYATYDAQGQPVTPGRATRVRLFETLIVPNETIPPARIVLRGKPPVPCCRWRTQVIAASGSEEASGWTEPPVPPTPTPAPRKKR